MEDEYTIIKIRVFAPTEAINGPLEMTMADELYDIEQELMIWLNNRAVGWRFRFELLNEDGE